MATLNTQGSLESEITAVFQRACRERDLEVAEFLLQALEKIAHREGGAESVERAHAQLMDALPAGGATH